MSAKSTLRLSVIAIDDEEPVLRFVEETLRVLGIKVLTTSDPWAGLDLIRLHRPNFAILDLNMPAMSGLVLLEKVINIDPTIGVFLLTGDDSTSSAVQAIQFGALDYLTKPISAEKLRERFNAAIDEFHRSHENGEQFPSAGFHGIIGQSPRMLDMFSRMRRIGPHFRSVLITGASGTGKELVARALHNLSPAAQGPFVVCNCASVPEGLAESMWFGHVKGAFTGATQDCAGLFEHAADGTIFLDEIGEMPLGLQVKLLRVLQTHEIQRVGGAATEKLNLRVIAATNRDLIEEVRQKRFREDLYYRLSMTEISLPSLIERDGDFSLLQVSFIRKFAAEYKKPIEGITPSAQDLLSRFPWPGNVRQLENVMATACILAEGPMIRVCDLPPEVQLKEVITANSHLNSLAEVEKRHASRVLSQVGGNKKKAAQVLGISRSTLYQLLGL